MSQDPAKTYEVALGEINVHILLLSSRAQQLAIELDAANAKIRALDAQLEVLKSKKEG